MKFPFDFYSMFSRITKIRGKIRREISRSLVKQLNRTRQPVQDIDLEQNNIIDPNHGRLMSIRESNELQQTMAEHQEQWYDSDSSVSEFSVTYSDEDAD